MKITFTMLSILAMYIIKDYNYEILSMIANETMIIVNLIGIRLTCKLISNKITKEIGVIIYEQIG